ncbi:MAG TPA: hypothetical protein VGE39_06540 [Prosthecobacter sp.]
MSSQRRRMPRVTKMAASHSHTHRSRSPRLLEDQQPYLCSQRFVAPAAKKGAQSALNHP